MAKCPGCDKFASLETAAEVNQVEIDEEGNINGEVRVLRTSSCCGEEMKELLFEIEVQAEIPEGHTGEGHELSVDANDPEPVEEGGGRYAKSYIGATLELTVRCSCQPKDAEPLCTVEWTDKAPASTFEELT